MVNWQWCLASSLCRGSKALSSAALLSSSSRVVAFRERCRRRTGIAFATDIATRLPRICPATNRGISSSEPCKDTVRMTFVEDDGNVVEVEAEPGQTLLEVAHENDVDLEGTLRHFGNTDEEPVLDNMPPYPMTNPSPREGRLPELWDRMLPAVLHTDIILRVGGERYIEHLGRGHMSYSVSNRDKNGSLVCHISYPSACGGDLACSTCHVVLPQEFYEKLGEKSEEEEDMLDLAWGLTDTSRLGCQIKVSQELEGMKIKIPEDSVDLS